MDSLFAAALYSNPGAATWYRNLNKKMFGLFLRE
jgi:hypothetical protein